ncbi:MAG: hypothetical protein DRN49_05865 [Thaumarchaeota archaeon]|nr:MAG: hypothetical protein DRN49_05865 [Nitrososphaerota archaeon]
METDLVRYRRTAHLLNLFTMKWAIPTLLTLRHGSAGFYPLFVNVQAFGVRPTYPKFREFVERLATAGIVKIQENTIELTDKGMKLAEMAVDLISKIEKLQAE